MELTVLYQDPTGLRAGYSCPCGCNPSVHYARGADVAHEGCCCGNQFAVGPDAAASLPATAGFQQERRTFDAPWGERLQAAWLVGPSVHRPAGGDDHDHEHGQDRDGATADGQEIDPACGMRVDPEAARQSGLHSTHEGRGYVFCGKGCKLEFDEDPGRYLDPIYMPSM